MNTLRRRDKTPIDVGFEYLMNAALAGFEADSRLACRALRVKMAVGIFGVGSVLPNDLPPKSPSKPLHESLISHTLQ
ncbi:hypothetical protein N5K35_01510 [Pseudomonas sp. GD03651]|uniref:hypothetical protein n=1 Tax=unclassified Pseudomonas TaxID=196821 RepID=UPI002447C9D6|nr:hypothetical protein [Pseudomonas sp. GD03651]MDH2182400.1 hypothetical protein [Pseudomonas sp. GD03651]